MIEAGCVYSILHWQLICNRFFSKENPVMLCNYYIQQKTIFYVYVYSHILTKTFIFLFSS